MYKNKKSTVKLNRYKKRGNHSEKRKRTSKLGGTKPRSAPTRRQVPPSVKATIAKTNTAKQAATKQAALAKQAATKKVALAKQAVAEQVASTTNAAKQAVAEQVASVADAAKLAVSAQVASATDAANRRTYVQNWNKVREEHGIKNGKSFFSHLPKLIPQSDSSSPEFHFHIPTSNEDLVTEMAHELLSHEIKKHISESAFGGDEDVQKYHADKIATGILEQKFAKKRIYQLSNKMGQLESKVTNQVRHDLFGAIPIPEVGEVINVVLDGLEDTFKTGSTAFSAVKLGTTIRKMIQTIQNNPAITEQLKSQLHPDAAQHLTNAISGMLPAAGGANFSGKRRKSRRRGIPLRDARRDARLLIRGGACGKKITKKNKTRN